METTVTLDNGWTVKEKNGIITINDGKVSLVIAPEIRKDVLEAIAVCGQQSDQSERRGRVKDPKKSK